jgi:hypothetical protein
VSLYVNERVNVSNRGCRRSFIFRIDSISRKVMSLKPRICFVCRMQTYCLEAHLKAEHSKCPTCGWWSAKNIRDDSRCARCVEKNVPLPEAPPSPTIEKAANAPRPYFTRKCEMHRGQHVSIDELRSCRGCSIVPISRPLRRTHLGPFC